MTLKDMQDRADRLAKGAMLFIPVVFVIMSVTIVCQPNHAFIAPGLVIALALCMIVLVLALVPSYVLDRLAQFLERLNKDRNHAES